MDPTQMQSPPAAPTQAPDQSQNPVPQQGEPDHGISQDDLAAILGYITTIEEHHTIGGSQSPQDGKQGPETQQPQEDPKQHIDALQSQIDALKGEVEKIPQMMKDEMAQLKQMIADAVNQDESKDA